MCPRQAGEPGDLWSHSHNQRFSQEAQAGRRPVIASRALVTSSHFLDAGGARSIFLAVSLAITPDGSITERKRFGRWRTRFSPTERREITLVNAFAEISEAQPPKLREIIERSEAIVRFARLRRDKALETDALEIETRAKRRLRALERQGERETK